MRPRHPLLVVAVGLAVQLPLFTTGCRDRLAPTREREAYRPATTAPASPSRSLPETPIARRSSRTARPQPRRAPSVTPRPTRTPAPTATLVASMALSDAEAEVRSWWIPELRARIMR
jgi:hypothetical protein